MKKLILFIVLSLILMMNSCGLLDSENHSKATSINVARIYSVNIDGSNLKLISVSGSFIVSQSGDSIFYIDKNYHINYINSDGTNNQLLTSASVQWFRLASSGNILCTLSGSDPYFLNTNGSGLTKIPIPGPVGKYINAETLDISPAGDKVVFAEYKGLFVMDYDGQNIHQLKDSSGISYYEYAHFAQNGESIIYIHHQYSTGENFLKLYNLNTDKDSLLYKSYGDNLVGVYDVSPWNTVLFSFTGGIYLLNLKDNAAHFLTYGMEAGFSNDSTKITYCVFPNAVIYTLDIKSGITTHTIINLPGNYIYNPHLSTINNRITFRADSSYITMSK